MVIRNKHWYDINQQRYYPVDDTASARSNAGEVLPSALIADLRIRWPLDLGRYAFLSSVSLTQHLVTVLISATNTLDNSTGATLIAGITLPKTSATEERTYPLQAFAAGAGGFIAFGSLTIANYTGQFNSPLQTLLTPRAARASRRPPVRTIGVENASFALTGLVNLAVTPPLRAEKAVRIIDGVEQSNVIVVRLEQPAVATAVDTAVPSVFKEFAGPCGKRPGSRTCGDPQPIETINGVGPDCDGIITLNFQGCAVVGSTINSSGIVVDCSLDLTQSCAPLYLPDLQTGKLPSETPPNIITPSIPVPPPPLPLFSISESVTTVLALPYCDPFDDAVAHGFAPLSAGWGFTSADSPADSFCCAGPPKTSINECSVSSFSQNGELVAPPKVICSYGTILPVAQTTTNISLWSFDVQTLFRTYTTDFKVVYGQPGSRKNAGILVNYRLETATIVNYLVAKLNIDNSTFGIYFFNGLSFSSLGQVEIPDARADDWYRISFTVQPNPTNLQNVLLIAVLNGITDPTISAIINSSLPSNLWRNDSGIAGLWTERSKSYFSFWRVDEAPL